MSADQPWWTTAVTYQIYPRSFADSNGDGVGDLPGIRSRLDYLVRLGVDAVWLTPFYPSPQVDAGYDVSDYRGVDPVYGSLDDVRALIDDAHGHGLRVLVDLVPNHTSDQHPWFRAAAAAVPGSAERDRYVFRPGRGADGAEPPTDWQSNFGGPAWTRLPDGEWYLHLFSSAQPDLNWTNHDVRAEFDDILRYWFDFGVDGIRIDVAHGLVKDPQFADLPTRADPHLLAPDNVGDHPHWDRDELHEIYRGWRRLAEGYGGERIFVAETAVPNMGRFADYLRGDELHTAFNFAFLEAGWDARRVRAVVDETLAALRPESAAPTWLLSNHDVVRHSDRFGGGELGRRRARAALLLMLALPGGVYLYQGEELGLPEVHDIAPGRRRDPIFFRTGGARPGRDGARVPLPWSGTQPPYGFSSAADTWLPQPPDWAELTVDYQDDRPDSTLSFYRQALALRRTTFATVVGNELEWLELDAAVLGFVRGAFACVINFGDEPVDLTSRLPGWSAMVPGAGDRAAPVRLVPNNGVWLVSEA